METDHRSRVSRNTRPHHDPPIHRNRSGSRSRGVHIHGIRDRPTILIDLGLNTRETTGNWNNFHGNSAGVNPANLTGLVDTDGNITTINLAFAEDFATAAGIAGTVSNYDGPYPAPLAGIPQSALRDDMFAQQDGTATLTFSGLDPSLTYNWTFNWARGNNGGGARYELNGTNSGIATITSVHQNSTEVATLTGISPTPGGVVTLTVTQTVSGSDKHANLNFIRIDAIIDPDIQVPATYSFPPILPSATIEAQIPVENIGQTQSLQIASVVVTGVDADRFSVESFPASVAATGEDSIAVTFDPVDAQGTFTATLEITSNTGGIPGTPTFVELSASSDSTFDSSDTILTFTFRRSSAAAGDNPFVEYGSDLANWTAAAHGTNGIVVTVVPNGFDTGIDLVSVAIPRALAADRKLFARITVTVGLTP